ncbi:nucleotidyltransferase family protein [Bacillus sp. AK128]
MLDTFISELYDPSEVLPKQAEYYQRLLNEIDQHGISSQIYNVLHRQGRLNQTPVFFQEYLHKEYKETLYLNLFIKNQLKMILSAFEEKSIEVIPIKGIGFAEHYFGHIGARGTSDIDILINREDLVSAIECVKSLGFILLDEQIPFHFHVSLSKNIPGSPLPLNVEIHWNIVKDQTSSFEISEFWKRSSNMEGYEYVKKLSDYHTFYLICLHGWRHNLDSAKYYIDLIQLIMYVKDIDYKLLLEDARRHKTYRRMIRTLSILYKEFPFLHKVIRFPYAKDKNYITTFNNQDASKLEVYKDFIAFQFLSYDSFRHIFLEFGNWCIPTRKEILVELKKHKAEESYFADIKSLYTHRISSIVKALFVKTQ